MILEKNNFQTVQEWTKSYIELIALYVHPKNSHHLRSHVRATNWLLITVDYAWKTNSLENKSGRIFLPSTSFRSLLYKILLTNLGRFILFIHHLSWNSTMRRCFYHTDLGQNGVFQNFEIQIALIQYSGQSKHAWAISKAAKKIQNHLYGQPVASCGVFEWTLIESRFNIIKNLSCLFFV